jgi:hypothetical protein
LEALLFLKITNDSHLIEILLKNSLSFSKNIFYI